MAVIKVAEYNEVSEGGMKKVMVNSVPVALYKLNGEVFATSNICTYDGSFLDENHKMHNYMIECTQHGCQWDIRTGEVVLAPATEKLKTYKTEIISDDIYIHTL